MPPKAALPYPQVLRQYGTAQGCRPARKAGAQRRHSRHYCAWLAAGERINTETDGDSAESMPRSRTADGWEQRPAGDVDALASAADPLFFYFGIGPLQTAWRLVASLEHGVRAGGRVERLRVRC
jgi:hypothetical protein